MHFGQSSKAGKLWWDALRARWSLRRAAGESRWQLGLHTLRWLFLFSRQSRWLRALDARRTTRNAAKADPRLYERWHHPYISTRFDGDTRRRIVSAHYHFLMQRFPAQLCERIVRGHGVRLTSLWLEDTSRVHVHLGKPNRAETGELSLSLLTEDKDPLASCILTFDRHDSLLVGAVHGAGLHTPYAASSAFIRGSHGMQPRDLIVALMQAMAIALEVKRVRVVSTSASLAPETQGGENDLFWQGHGAVLDDAGYLQWPLMPARATEADSVGNRDRRQRRECFRRQACDGLIDAFSTKNTTVNSSTEDNPSPAANERCRGRKPVNAGSGPDALLAAGL